MSPERLCESGIVTENYFDEGVAARYDETIGSWGDPSGAGPEPDSITLETYGKEIPEA
jgi:hypothetical protein